ncbi:hypothetical protein EDD68_10926 [Melghiribacillus thermohalophilus]|uniref:Uncharacterized protein n=1 Tax=Melghiribacillus thermohalophilus TaxID=1324956 RepID=A0A4R3N046_9BACI|nr:hypothetical protein [Melghiribacillus thermohalophilus]TCT22380.1 hypothetical protein EDD68_10926 [Melghiribacillus thermohalophilus]
MVNRDDITIGDPDPHFDTRRDGIYNDNTGVKIGMIMNEQPGGKLDSNPFHLSLKRDPRMKRFSEVMRKNTKHVEEDDPR